MQKREKRLTKREKKALAPPRPAQQNKRDEAQHIHCIACGKHLDPVQFDPPATATTVQCEHKSTFASCTGCVPLATELLAEHDRTGQAVKVAAAWH